MTVCIAAIYNNNAILGASDRMVTGGYGDITFEPTETKILKLTNSIAVMTAGDQSIQIQVYQEASKVIEERIKAEPSNWIKISDAADIYSKCFYGLRNKKIESQILSQYNLTFESFIEKQKNMDQVFINIITNKIDRFLNNLENIATVVAGIDSDGPHIYVVENGKISCHDKLGFVSIGIGRDHAISHFMFSGYSRSCTESKALLTIHQAKKKSEVSPGVGKATDMCVIGPKLGSFSMISEPIFTKPIIKDLDKFYQEYRNKIEKLDKKTEEKIKDYLDKLSTPPILIQEANPPSITVPSSIPVLTKKVKSKNKSK